LAAPQGKAAVAVVHWLNKPLLPRIAVIVPVLNEAGGVEQCVRQFQHWPQPQRLELIVVEGGSDDHSAFTACVQSHAVVLNSLPGRAKQMNAGAAHTSADLLVFLHVDTELPHSAYEQLLSFWASQKAWGRFDVRLSGRQWPLRIIERFINWRSRLTAVATGDQAVFVKADVFKALNGYADIPLMEDVELTKRLKTRSRPWCVNDPVITSSRRWETHGIIKTVLLMWYLRFAYFIGVRPSTLAQRY